GRFELAHGGTLFLDEIGELPHAVQSKLLRALESGRITRLGGPAEIDVDVRVVAATNRDLETAVRDRAFREDLYFRLAVFPVHIPPLRARREDISLLAKHFATESGREIRGRSLEISPAALEVLDAYAWPGNVRELQNCIERACILARGAEIESCDLDLRGIGASPTLANLDYSGTLADVSSRAVHIVERRKIAEALEASGGNRTKAAEALGVSTKTLLSKIREFGL
ncbi:MAG TPA: sigma 54-interacting transcriptional regulator, partial [Blastocatellia bacterium]|nr:sigma 54-interacting transcriptional regulator [Blastocatellia bacterium]